MRLQQITFEHFFIEVIPYIEKDLIDIINPEYMSFYKCGHTYLGLSYGANKEIIVNLAIYTGKKITEFEKFWQIIENNAKINGINTIIFITSENNKIVKNIAQKAGCYLDKIIDKYYPDGSNGLYFVKTIE